MTEAEGIRSPLHDAQIAAGAEIIWEDGWPWAMKVGKDAVAEYEAIRTATGIWDLFSTCKYEITGPDAVTFVQRRFTNDLSEVTSGGVRYGAFVNADGSLIDDGNVYRHSDDKLWAFINTADMEAWFRESADGLDAAVEHRTADWPMISVQGPGSRDLLQGMTDAPLGDLRYFRFWPDPVKIGGVPATVLRTGFSGELGFELVTSDAESVQTLWQALNDAGATPFGLEAVDIARVESGMIIIALDYMPGEGSPYDVSMDRFVKAGVGCVADDALALIGSAPPKRLKTLKIDGDAPEAGSAVTASGREVGTLTSPVSSPRFGAIGLAVLASDAAVDGATVQVGGVSATIAPLSIYDPTKQRPRG